MSWVQLRQWDRGNDPTHAGDEGPHLVAAAGPAQCRPSQLREGRATYSQSPEDFAAQVPELLKAGVNGIGGCCGTTPQHIHLMARKIREESRPASLGKQLLG